MMDAKGNIQVVGDVRPDVADDAPERPQSRIEDRGGTALLAAQAAAAATLRDDRKGQPRFIAGPGGSPAPKIEPCGAESRVALAELYLPTETIAPVPLADVLKEAEGLAREQIGAARAVVAYRRHLRLVDSAQQAVGQAEKEAATAAANIEKAKDADADGAELLKRVKAKTQAEAVLQDARDQAMVISQESQRLKETAVAVATSISRQIRRELHQRLTNERAAKLDALAADIGDVLAEHLPTLRAIDDVMRRVPFGDHVLADGTRSAPAGFDFSRFIDE
jgi:hypothetical protein